MPKEPKDDAIEDRIHNEAVVDAYDEEERAMGWYYYLENKMQFPLEAKCTKRERTSPLKVGATVRVTGMAPVEECENRVLVTIDDEGDDLDVPLAQLEPTENTEDDETREAIYDWHYWVNRGYQF